MGKSIKEKLISLLGDLPEPKVGLQPKVIREERLKGHKRLLVEYFIEDNERALAYLLIPNGRIRDSPAILAIHQDAIGPHHDVGKSQTAGLTDNKEQHYGLDLCHRGYVVLCPDRPCFEDRKPKESEMQEMWGFLGEWRDFFYREWVATKLLFEGRTMAGKELQDLKRGIDYLCQLEEVDETRIGSIGHSAGGFLTPWLMMFDERVKVGYSSCGTAPLKSLFEPKTRHIAAAICAIPSLFKVGDTDDVLACLAPRPFMESRGDKEFPEEFLKKLYSRQKTGTNN